MPVSPGKWLSNSVNASSPPAEAPTPATRGSELPVSRFPAAGRAIAEPETGLTAAVGFFPGERIGRFGREPGARGDGGILPGRGLPVFFATRHHYLSRRDERASSPDGSATKQARGVPLSHGICAGAWSSRWRPAT